MVCGDEFNKRDNEVNDKELVEKVAKELCKLDGHIWGLTSIPFMHKGYIDKAKQIIPIIRQAVAEEIKGDIEKNWKDVSTFFLVLSGKPSGKKG